jgi:hypothetical protein
VNIFVLDKSPVMAARMLCDAHVVKMIVESCQLLSTHDRITYNLPDYDKRYAVTHVNHPCRVCLSNENNYAWLRLHLCELLCEYTRRYDEVHACAELASACWGYTVKDTFHGYGDLRGMNLAIGQWCKYSTFPKCMPDEYKTEGNTIDSVIESYRNYYRYKKVSMERFTYTNRNAPKWLLED